MPTKQAMLAFVTATPERRAEAVALARNVIGKLSELNVPSSADILAKLVFASFDDPQEASDRHVAALRAAGLANRQVAPMNTALVRILPGEAYAIECEVRVAFQIDRVYVSDGDVGGAGKAANWIVNDLRIDDRNLMAVSGSLPGDMFGNSAIQAFIDFGTAQPGEKLRMIVTYQGPTASGTPFYGSIIGTAVGTPLPTAPEVETASSSPELERPKWFWKVSPEDLKNEDSIRAMWKRGAPSTN